MIINIQWCTKKESCANNEPHQFIKFLIKNLESFVYEQLNPFVFKWCKSANSEFRTIKKTYRKSDIQIANANEKLDTMLSKVNASQISRQMIGNIHNGFQPFACIMTERVNTLVFICVA